MKIFCFPVAFFSNSARRAISAIAATPALIAGFLAALLPLAEPALAAPGDVEPGFNPGVNGLWATAVQPDGKILLAGDFTSVAGTERTDLARLNADGTLDNAFNPNISGYASSAVYAVTVQADGKIVFGGNFISVGGVPRNALARLNADGTLDSGFNSGINPNSNFRCVAIQPDGKILIGGGFDLVSGRNYLVRVNPNGSLDSSFNPNITDFSYNGVIAAAIQADGKVLIAGYFNSVGGITRNYVARLNSNGTVDAAFNPNPNGLPSAMSVQADGMVLLGGDFTTVGGTARNYAARVNANGTLDAAFNPNATAGVYALTLQADGKAVLGGNFTSVGGIERNYIARVNANGTLDNTLNPNPNSGVSNVVVQADGKVLLSGGFSSIGGVPASGIARLSNDPAIETLSIAGANRVEWLRGGALPEVEQVAFELSTDGGNTFTALGTGTRIAGGWEKTGLSLPASGEIRARGRTTGGNGRGSGVVEKLAAFGSAAPEISVEQPAGTDLADGGNASFGNVGIGDGGTSRTFTIRNTGTASLTGLTIAKDGPDQAMFAIMASPNQPVPGGGSTTFTVRFTPAAMGSKTVALHIASNDSDENAFDITLTGTGALSTNADLSALTMSAGGFVPSFASGATSYATSIASQTDSVTFTPTTASTAATVKVNGVTVASGATSAQISLTAGANVITTTVTAGDGVSTKTYTVTLTRPAPGSGAGDLDAAFDAGVVFSSSGGDGVSALAVQADGKIVFGGKFSSVAGITRNNLARLHADGTLDAAFNPNADTAVSSVVVQTDGKIVIGGRFTSIAGNARTYLARLNADGTLDTGFNPNSNGLISCLALQADGKILVSGLFSSVGGSARSQFARLNTDGTADSAFNPNVSNMVEAIAVQADGKIVIGGSFFAVDAVTRNHIARLNANGTLDTGFNPNASSDVYCLAVQPDGKILFGGNFNSVTGIARSRLARVNADGTLDSAFYPDVENGFVYSLAVQADGKVVLGGAFSGMHGVTRNYLARVHADGTLDSAFNPGATILGFVNGVALQADGRVLVGGEFYSVGGAGRPGLARLLNDPATQSLTIASASRVEWLRGGSAPEASQVAFELSIDGGNTFSALGAATRIAGGWEKAGLSLPANGEIRARGRTSGGYSDGSSAFVETITAFGSAAPEIAMELPPGTNIADGGSASFGDVAVGDSLTRTFTIKNIGTASLTGLALAIEGPDAAKFSITSPPAATVPGSGGSTSFTVRFSPTATGSRSAALRVVSNDSDEAPFDITLTGTGTLSTNANLAALSLSAGTLTPVFSSATTSYTASVGFNAITIAVTPTRAQSTATITVNGVTVTSGSASPPISLNVGANLVSIVVTAGDGSSTKTYSVTITRAVAGPGDVDMEFNPGVNGEVSAAAVQPDGKVIIGGAFTNVGGTPRNKIARLNANGTLDSAFDPNVNGGVSTVAVQADGRIIIGGGFNSVAGNTRNGLARLHADGTLDTAFDPNVNNYVYTVALQADGKIIIGGDFLSVGGIARNYVARVNGDGTLDSGFNPNAGYLVSSVAVQADGKVLLGGWFLTIGGVARNHVARLNANGTLDSAFNPNADSTVNSILVQPDGKILIGGGFTTLGGTPRNCIARLNVNGTLDSGFNPGASGTVNAIAVQADGKVLFGGYFTSVGGSARNRIARLSAGGALDNTFDPNADNVVYSVAVQADGRVLLGGEFANVGGVARSRMARLSSEPATQSLTVPGATRVEWLRGGASPEVSPVTFELSTDGGNTYSAPGAGTRIAGGWERTGLSLPASGEIRARGRTTNGGNGSGVVETLAAFGSAAPEIAIEQPPGTNIADGGSTNFGDVAVGDSVSHTFTVKNTGTASLTGLTVTKDGADAAMFTITSSPVPPVPGGGSTTFSVRFAPGGTGARAATFHLASNDGDESSFDLTLTGTGTLSTNANLAALSLSAGILDPVFYSATTSYSTALPFSTGAVTVTAGAAQSAAMISVNGTPVASGVASAPVSLSVGPNIFAILVTAGDGVTTRNYTITVTRAAPVSGEVEADFNPNGLFSISSLAVQPDGKVLIGGNYILARLLPNGTVQTDFDPGAGAPGGGPATVHAMAVQTDGKILVGGAFYNPIIRLNSDVSAEDTATFDPGSGPDDTVQGMALQSDGKILIAGRFDSVNGQPRGGIARLHPNGAVEGTATFNPGTGADGIVNCVAVQADGRILLGGSFTSINGQPRNRIARLNPDGTLESTATFDAGDGTDGSVHSIALQADGKILLGGNFTSVSGQSRSRIARLNANGSVESTTTFNSGTGADGRVRTIAVQANGKILLGGDFFSVNEQPRGRIARLNPDGSVEGPATFYGGWTDSSVNCLALQPDGKILAGGNFFSINGQPHPGLARLLNEPAMQSLSVPDSTRVQWVRGGSSPEIEQVTFELSTDAGASWSLLGSGTRIPGGWERNGLSLPGSGTIRARGRAGSTSGPLEQSASFGLLTPLQQWKMTYFGDANAPDAGDPDGDGLPNVLEFAYGLNPTRPDTSALPQFQLSGVEYVVSFATPGGVSGITYGAEWSRTMLPGSWTAIPDTGTDGQHTFRLPMTGLRQFLRLKVTAP